MVSRRTVRVTGEILGRGRSGESPPPRLTPPIGGNAPCADTPTHTDTPPWRECLLTPTTPRKRRRTASRTERERRGEEVCMRAGRDPPCVERRGVAAGRENAQCTKIVCVAFEARATERTAFSEWPTHCEPINSYFHCKTGFLRAKTPVDEALFPRLHIKVFRGLLPRPASDRILARVEASVAGVTLDRTTPQPPPAKEQWRSLCSGMWRPSVPACRRR